MKASILAMMLFLVCLTAQAQDIRFVTEHFAPFQIKEEGEKVRGFAIDMVTAMQQLAGHDEPLKVYPWARAYQMALDEPGTFIFSIARTKERERLFKWVGDYYDAIDALFALKKRKDIVIHAIEDAKNYKTAVARGDNAAQRLEKLGFTKKHLYYVKSQEHCIRLLQKERVDLNSNAELGFYSAVKKLGFAPEAFRRVFIISQVPLGIAAQKDTPDELVEKMRLALEKLKKDGTHNRLMKKWFPSHAMGR